MSVTGQPRKIVIDTDPGVDDAMAIFVALERHRRREVDILAVTLVNGNTDVDNQVKNNRRIFATVPESLRSVPVYIGAHEGLVHKFELPAKIPPFHGSNGFCDVIFDPDPADHPVHPFVGDEHAANAINSLINKHPGEVTIVALGPLTNIALAMKLNRNFETNIKELVIMGGNKDGIGNITTTAEFNFFSDPESAQVVFKRLENLSQVKATMVTWELCKDSYFLWEWRQTHLAKLPGERIKLMNILDEHLHKNTLLQDRWILCDVYAMAVALDPSCVKASTKYSAFVETQGSRTRGQVVLEKRFLTTAASQTCDVNVDVVEEVDGDVVRRLIVEAMTDHALLSQPENK